MSISRNLSLAAGLVLLTACSAGTVIYPVYLQPSYEPDFASQAASYGGVKVQVVGNPFAAEQSVVERGIVDAMQGSTFGPRLNFTEADVQRSPYRVVVLFDPARNANQARVCAEPDQPRHSAGGVKVLMAFCNGSTRVSSTIASMAQPRGVDDPAFRAMLRNVTTLLVPPRREDQGDNSFKNT